MSTLYDRIYKLAEPYWATRKNNLHVPSSYDFARRLLSFYPSADEDIVLPAVLLHDVGWKMVPEEKQRDAFGPEVKDQETRRFHETEGVRIAREILASLAYDKEKTIEILSIIDGHDTRKEASVAQRQTGERCRQALAVHSLLCENRSPPFRV